MVARASHAEAFRRSYPGRMSYWFGQERCRAGGKDDEATLIRTTKCRVPSHKPHAIMCHTMPSSAAKCGTHPGHILIEFLSSPAKPLNELASPRGVEPLFPP